MATKFETESCGRCGGSGSYSYCSMHGSTCFGCGGSGRKLSKRGAAARAFYFGSLNRVATEIKVGEQVWSSGPSLNSCNVWNFVVGVEADTLNPGRVTLRLERKGREHSLGVFETSELPVCRDQAHLTEAMAAALAYQSTLNKLGKVAGRKAKETA